MKTSFGLALILSLSACTTGRYAASGSTGITPFMIERFDAYLANGMRVIVDPDHRAPVIAMTTIVRVGAASDPEGKGGLAHLTARLTLRAREASGTSRQEAYVSTAAADAMSFADVDQTSFEATGLSTLLTPLLKLQAAQLLHPVDDVSAADLVAERVQINEERQLRIDAADPLELVTDLRHILFPPGEPYGRPPEGSLASLAAIGTGDVEAFARANYRPTNATLVIVGDVDPGTVQSLVSQIYGSPVQRAAEQLVSEGLRRLRAQPIPSPTGKKDLAVVEGNVPTPELLLGWILPGRFDASAPPAELIASIARDVLVRWVWPPPHDAGIVTATPRRRLGQIVPPVFLPERSVPLGVASWGRVSGVSSLTPFEAALHVAPDPNAASVPLVIASAPGIPSPQVDRDIEEVEFFAVPGLQATILVGRIKLREGSHPDETLENVLDHLRVLWEGGIGHRAVFLTESALSARVVLEAESPPARSRLVASFASSVGGVSVLSKMMERLDLRAARIEHYAWDHLRRDNLRALLVRPRAAERVVHVHPMPAWAVEGGTGAQNAGGEPAPTIAGPLPAVAALNSGAIRSFTLKNGIEVVTVARRGIPVVTVGAMLRVGTGSGRPLGVVDAALRVTHPGRRYGDPNNFGVIELVDARPDAITFEQQGGAEHLGKMLAMLSDRFKNVYAERSHFEHFRQHTLAAWSREEARPRARAEREFWKTLFGDHAFGFRAVAADLEKVKLSDIERWVKQTYRPESVIVVIAGDFEASRAEQLARYWLEDWTNDTPLPQGQVQVIPELEGVDQPEVVLVTRRPGSAVADIRLGCLLPDSVEERDVVAYDLASELLARRFERGLPPVAGGGNVANESGRLLGGTTALVVSTTVDGPSAVEAVRRLRRDLDELASGGVTANELAQARWSVARRHFSSFVSTPETVHAVLEARKRGLPVSWFQRYSARLAITSPEQVQAALKACHERNVLSLLADEPQGSAAAAHWKRAVKQ